MESDVDKLISLIRDENGASRRRVMRKFGWSGSRATLVINSAIFYGVVRSVKRKPGRQYVTIYEPRSED